MTPPTRPLASKTRTGTPRRRSSNAAVRPVMPAPMIATGYMGYLLSREWQPNARSRNTKRQNPNTRELPDPKHQRNPNANFPKVRGDVAILRDLLLLRIGA